MKERRIIIKCSEKTQKMWRIFVVEKGFKNYEEALKFLLSLYEQVSKIKPEIETF